MDGLTSANEMYNEGAVNSNSNMSSFSYDQRNPAPAAFVDIKPRLVLQSPGGGDPLTFVYTVPNTEFVDILKLALEEFDSLRPIVNNCIDNLCLDDLYNADFDTLSNVCMAFNKAAPSISSLGRGFTKLGSNSDLTSPKFLQRIITHCYNKAVENERALNKHYEPFSSCTYGETSFERMQTIIDEIKPTPQDVFVDLGSGVGQLVAHIAGGSKVKKAFGIEISELPARFAARLEEEFRKLMRFYGKKMRQFSLERGDFLDPKYRELITKEATIIFINNFAFRPDLESKIKYELLFELQSGTKIISTKPYASLKAVQNDRQMNDLSSILDITELKHCPNACSWTSNNVTYYLHVVDHGKIEKYVTSKKPGSLRNTESRRSSTPSSSKNSNSRESSVNYGPTTRKGWKMQVSMQDLSASERSSLSRRLSSESDDSEPEKKRKRKNKQNKERSKSRKPKNAGTDMDLVDSDANLSKDAKDGIELMHQMTQAVSAGQPVDTTKTAMLADLVTTDNPTKTSTKKRTTINGCKTDAMFPLTDALSATKRKKRASAPILPTDLLNPASKYSHLDVFLTELRRTYEDFLDKIHTPPAVNPGERTDQEIKHEVAMINGAQLNNPNVNATALERILQMIDRISQKQSELNQEVGMLRRAVVGLFSGNPVDSVVQQPVQNSSLPINGIHQHRPGNTSGLTETSPQISTDTANRYANLMQNGSAQNNATNIIKTYMSLLSSNYPNSVPTSNTAHINSALIALQNSQHLSPQQQQHSLGQYTNQLNGSNMNDATLNANTLNQHSLLQWSSDIVPQLNAFLSSNDYTPAVKGKIITELAQQNPAFSTLLQLINDPSLPSQLRANASSLSFSSPTGTAQPDVFSHLTAEATTSNGTNNHLLLAQKPMVYTSQTPLSVENQLGQSYAPTNKTLKDDLQKPRKKTERKPRANAKKSKESNATSLSSALNEASGSNESVYTNAFNGQFPNNQTMTPIGVEKILSQQLSVQQSLSLEPPSFHSPSL